MMRDTHRIVIKAMRGLGVRRLITISAFGVGKSRDNVWWPLRLVLFSGGMKIGMEDHDAVEKLVREEGEKGGLEWTLVKPVMLGEGPKREEVVVFGEDGRGTGCVEKVGRETVAGFVVERCLEGSEWVGGTPVIGER